MAKGERNTGWTGFFRIFVVLCAVMGLLARQGTGVSDSGAFEVYRLLTLWAVPALFMLWGMDALEDGKAGTVSGALVGYALPVFCMLVFWGAVYAVAAHLLGGGALSWRGIWSAIVAAAKGDTYFHLELLYPLLGICLLLPVLRRFVSSAGRWEVLYFLGLCFLFASVLPLWSALDHGGTIPTLLRRMDVSMVLGYVGYFVGGWYLHHYTIGRPSEYILYLLGACGLAVTVMAHRALPGLDGVTAPGTALAAAALCTLFRYVLGISDERSRRRSVYNLGRYAFGVYLTHQLWVLIFRWFGGSILAFPAVVSVPFFAILFFALSVPVALLLGLIPGAGRWLT